MHDYQRWPIPTGRESWNIFSPQLEVVRYIESFRRLTRSMWCSWGLTEAVGFSTSMSLQKRNYAVAARQNKRSACYNITTLNAGNSYSTRSETANAVSHRLLFVNKHTHTLPRSRTATRRLQPYNPSTRQSPPIQTHHVLLDTFNNNRLVNVIDFSHASYADDTRESDSDRFQTHSMNSLAIE